MKEFIIFILNNALGVYTYQQFLNLVQTRSISGLKQTPPNFLKAASI
jgi:hypothetical protein